MIKRAFDITVAFLGLFLLSPILLLAALLIKRDSLGPIFFRQERIGRGFRSFFIYGRFVIAGYGDISFTDPENENSYFGGKFAPILLFQLSDKINVETELEFSIGEGGTTETELEYAEAHYFVTDSSTISAGKLLLPFGQFGPNLHPSWINKLPTNPGIYGGHGGHGDSGGMEGLIPILSDFGVGYQKTIRLGEHQRLFIDLYVVNGPGTEGAAEEGHDEEPEGDEHDEESLLPEIAFEAEGADNNGNKALVAG